jgi:23S rRNA-/tRNA-specific pseudouridylate synthase
LKQTTTETICAICDVVFDSPQELQGHLQAPAVPFLPVAEARAHKVPTCENHDNTLNDYIQEPKQSIGDVEWIVEVDDTSRELRLRHFLQQHSKLSKNQAEKRLQQSCVTVNQVVVRNPTHRLEAKDVVEMRQLVSDPLPVDIVYHKNSIVVAFKPVGMRTVGSFSPETLESRVSNQLGVAYHSLSKMTTGCAGLVVLQPARTFSGQMVVEHIFTALVHGCVEWTEKSFDAVIEGARLWKKRPSQEMSADESSYDGDRDSNQEAAADTMVHVLCTEQCRDPPLSTLVLTCLPSVRADSISYTLRTKLGHAVVNDRFAKSEYLSLPRSIRNLIKNRFCMGCFAVRLSGEAEITKPVPERLSAHRWRQHVLKGEKTDKERKNPV